MIAHRIARFVIPALRDREWPSAPAVAVDVKLLDEYVGDYELGGTRLRIWREASALFVSAAGRGRATMIPVSRSEFMLDVDRVRFWFARPSKGPVELFVRDGGERRATRIR